MGKHGFVSHRKRVDRVINLRDLAPLIAEPPDAGSKDALPVVDLTRLGYGKLLGKGDLNRPVEVRVADASRSAMKKIEAAGGKVILPK
jgi:large subunit ribosomal protein L15